MESRGWIPETTGRGVLLTGYAGQKDTAISGMTPDLGKVGNSGDTTRGRESRKKGSLFLVLLERASSTGIISSWNI